MGGVKVASCVFLELVITLVTIKATNPDGYFTVIAPNQIMPNSVFTVWVSGDPLSSSEPPPLRIYLECMANLLSEIEGRSPVSNSFPIGTFGSLGRNEVRNATISIGNHNQLQPYEKCSLIAAHLESGTILDRKDIVVQAQATAIKPVTIFVQTSKPSFKPEETVRIRVIVLNENFLPIQPNLTLTIKDAKNIKVRNSNNQERPAEFQQYENGITKFKYKLASSVNFGMWSIIAESMGVQVTTTFLVNKYILPKFFVKIIPTVNYLVEGQSSSLTAEISAAYTYGKSLGSGSCSVLFYKKNTPVNGSPKTGVLTNGMIFMKFTASTAGTYRLVANVTEANTGRWTLGTLDFQVYKSEPVQITWLNPQKTYKPGYPINIQLAVSTLDNLPVTDTRLDAINIRSQLRNSMGVYEFESVDSSIPANGIVNFILSVPENPSTSFHSLIVSYKGKRFSLEVPRVFQSKSKVILDIHQLSSPRTHSGHEKFLRGSTYNFQIKASQPILSLVNYILWSGNTMVDFKVGRKVNTGSTPAQQGILSIHLPKKAYTQLTVLVFFVHKFEDRVMQQEIVSASTTWATNNYIDVRLSSERLQPAEEISLTFETHPGSTIGIRAVDQSVLLLKHDSMDHFDIDPKTVPFNTLWGTNHRTGFPSRSSVPDAVTNFLQEFQNLGLVVLSNVVTTSTSSRNRRSLQSSSQMDVDRPEILEYQFSTDNIRTRTEFPELWLWEELEALNETQIFRPKIPKIPDTITSWFITAFSVNKESGLAVTSYPKILQVFRPFFLTLNLPYSTMKHETFDLQVIVHNYLGEDIFAAVTFFNNDDDFQFVDTTERLQVNVTKRVLVPSNQVQVVKFVVTPLRLGMLKVSVQGVSERAGDALTRQLRVIAAGEKYSANKMQKMIKPRVLGSDGVPQHTERIITRNQRSLDSRTLRFSGDAMSPILNPGNQSSIYRMIKLPAGCGEQSMVGFYPNILALEYLSSLGKLTPEIEEAGKTNLRTGYTLQLKFYQLTEGSFNYHTTDEQASTWLTAFILRCFAASRKYIPTDIDNQVLINGMQFLLRKQNMLTGEFYEYGKSLYPDQSLQKHTRLAGGLGSEVKQNAFRYGLSAYITLALIEITDVMKDVISRTERMNIDAAKLKGLRFISSNSAFEDSDAYSLALITTCLQAANHDSADRFYNNLQLYSKLSNDSDMKHYEISQTTSEKITTPISIEITGYALMANLWRSQRSIAESLPIVRWLLSKRNAEGGFSSSQDTVVGLTALSMYARTAIMLDDQGFEVTVRTDKNDTFQYKVNKNNSITVEDFILPSETQWFDVTVRGTGSCFMEYDEVHYRSKRGVDESQFKIKATWKPTAEFSDEVFDLNLCVNRVEDNGDDEFEEKLMADRKIWCASSNSTAPGNKIRREKWCLVKKTGDVVATVDLPSGYAFDQEQLDRILSDDTRPSSIKNVESRKQGTQATVYYDFLTAEDTCIILPVSRLFTVSSRNKASILVMEYMNPNQHNATQLLDPAVKKTVCDLCVETAECDLVRNCGQRRRR